MPRGVNFETPAGDTRRAVDFYSEVFGQEINKRGEQDNWHAVTGKDEEPGIERARSPCLKLPIIKNTISVPSKDGFMEKTKNAGGKVTTPKMSIPGARNFESCVGTEGNEFGIMQADPDVE